MVAGGRRERVVDGRRQFILSLGGLIMADTKISDFGDIPALDLVNDRIPILDASGTGTAKNKLIAPSALMVGKLDLTGGTVTGQLVLTGASATGALNLSPTWNNAGTDFAGIYSRVTNTASGANSRLMSLGTVAAGELCYFRKDGTLVVPSGSVSSPALSFVASGDTGWFGSTGFSMYYGGANLGVHFGIVPNGNIMLGYNGHIKFNPGAANIGGEDVGIVRAAVAELRVTDASSGYGTLDVLGLKSSGTPGATYSGLVTAITVVNGIVTSVT